MYQHVSTSDSHFSKKISISNRKINALLSLQQKIELSRQTKNKTSSNSTSNNQAASSSTTNNNSHLLGGGGSSTQHNSNNQLKQQSSQAEITNNPHNSNQQQYSSGNYHNQSSSSQLQNVEKFHATFWGLLAETWSSWDIFGHFRSKNRKFQICTTGRETNFGNFEFLTENVQNWPIAGAGGATWNFLTFCHSTRAPVYCWVLLVSTLIPTPGWIEHTAMVHTKIICNQSMNKWQDSVSTEIHIQIRIENQTIKYQTLIKNIISPSPKLTRQAVRVEPIQVIVSAPPPDLNKEKEKIEKRWNRLL